MEDDYDTAPPMVEMSQDCMIEWDESKNIDLRQIIAKSPPFATPKSLQGTSESSNLLSDIKRRLDKGGGNDNNSPSSRTLQTQPPLSIGKSVKRSKQAEKEIDGIFSILKEEEDCIDKHSPHSGPTQISHENLTLRWIPKPNKSSSSLASRHRRRRREAELETNPENKRQQIASRKQSKQLDNRFCSPKVSELSESRQHNDAAGDFEKLLQEMSTPQSVGPPSRKPLRELDKNVVVTGPKSVEGRSSNQARECPPTKAKPRTQPNVNQNSGKVARVVPVAKHPDQSQPGSNRVEHLPSKQDSLNVNMAMPPPRTVTISENNDDDDDEFGDLDFSADDMANLDSLLSVTSSQHQIQHTKTKQTIHAIQSKPPPHATTQRKILSAKPVNPSVSDGSKDVQDEFGDFPDVDFDAIDEVISQRVTHYEQSIPNPEHSHKPTVGSTASLRNHDIVRNLRMESSDSHLSFLNFTRYKVLDVTNDAGVYNKKLSVSVWTDAMLEDDEKEKKIHRNCQVTTIQSENQDVSAGGDCHNDSITEIRRNVNYQESGSLHLRGEWYHTPVNAGDVVHVCSLTGKYRTDAKALPIILHSAPPHGSDVDDLVLVVHPDMLMTPSIISETVGCSRRAVLKSRIGSTGLSSKPALIGTMRHALFGMCMEEENFDMANVRRNVQSIVRANAEALVGCGMSSVEAERDVLNVLPIIKRFVAEFTTIGQKPDTLLPSPRRVVKGQGYQSDIFFVADSVHSIEEPVISPELALKGFVDAIFEARTETVENENSKSNHLRQPSRNRSLMGLELKTGHNQKTQNAHMAQLALYSLMLQVKYGTRCGQSKSPNRKESQLESTGAASGGLLLYLNNEGYSSSHVLPLSNEVKSLIGQRNVLATGIRRASRPRGISLSYDENSRDEGNGKRINLLPAPAIDLPGVLSTTHSCKRCYTNRECMLYAASENESSTVRDSHKDLMSKFTGHLKEDEIAYFRKWDRLIDLEAHASNRNVATSWLKDSQRLEKEKGEVASSLIYERPEPLQGARILIVFRRDPQTESISSLESLSFQRGCHVIVSTDGTSLSTSEEVNFPEPSGPTKRRLILRHQMHIARGSFERIENDAMFVSAKREDLERIRDMVERHLKLHGKKLHFRVDRENSSVGVGTLRQNLFNFFTADFSRSEGEELSQTEIAKQRRLPWLRDIIIRLKPPTFGSKKVESLFLGPGPKVPGCDLETLSFEFNKLNSSQKKAVEKVINAKDFTLIQGLPGTGKTSTLTFIARFLVARGKRVLITSYTHSAVDNVMMKLMEKGMTLADSSTGLPRLVRVGQKSSCHKEVVPLLVSELALQLDQTKLSTNSCLSQSERSPENPTAQSLKQVLSSAQIVCASALSVPRSPLLLHEQFDVVIIDEAGQISQPAILGTLMAADAFVLVGDHQQLPPLVTSEIAESGGYGVSMLKRLAEAHPTSIAPLTYQYRMHEAICRLSSEAVYGGRLKCGNDEVRTRILELPGFPSRLPSAVSRGVYPWLKGVIDPQKSVVFVDTDNIRTKPRPANERASLNNDILIPVEVEALETTVGDRVCGNITNPTEATLVRFILKGLISSGLPPSSAGVISPFRAQLRILEENPTIASWKREGLELSTIDRYQGRDKPVIILSFVRSNPFGRAGRLLQDMRRLNVALTRAKHKLIIVGSFSTLKAGSCRLRPVLARMNNRGQRFLVPENAIECYRIP